MTFPVFPLLSYPSMVGTSCIILRNLSDLAQTASPLKKRTCTSLFGLPVCDKLERFLKETVGYVFKRLFMNVYFGSYICIDRAANTIDCDVT